jgi:hypothetical protein
MRVRVSRPRRAHGPRGPEATRAVMVSARSYVSDHGWPTWGRAARVLQLRPPRNLVGCDIDDEDRVVPECQHIAVGDEVRLAPRVGLIVAFVEPGRSLVLRGGVPIGSAVPHTTSRGCSLSEMARTTRRDSSAVSGTPTRGAGPGS